MPTAGEYKHEPCGIPCHCYVRRRLHQSAYKKSCLRKQSDSSSQYSDSKAKKVTFNPILSVHSYDSEETAEKPDYKFTQKEAKLLQNYAHLSHSPTLCDKLTSLFGLRQCKPTKRSNSPVHQKIRHDYNNNAVGEMNAERICSLCESKRNQSPVRGISFQRARERTPSPCGFHQPYQARKDPRESPQYHRYASTRIDYDSRSSRRTPSLGKYHSPRRVYRPDSLSDNVFVNYESTQGYENMDTLTYIASTATGTACDIDGTIDLGGLTTYMGANSSQQSRPISIPVTIHTNAEEDKLEEYIYETPINNKEKEYEYISIKSNMNMKRSESANFEGNAIPASETGTYTSGLIKHRIENDLTAESIHSRAHSENTSTQSACDQSTIDTCPYDIKFLNECFKRPSPQTSEEGIEMSAESNTSDEMDDAVYAPRPQNKLNSPLVDILKMTPIALFWTACAFLIAMAFAYLFPCTEDDDDCY